MEAIYGELAAFLKDLDNSNWDMDKNGEKRVLRCLEIIDPKCVLDVGANVGEWSTLVSHMYSTCEIHSFEIVPSTYEKLVNNTKFNDLIITNNYGLSDATGNLVMNLSETDSTVATACPIQGSQYHRDFYTAEIKCEVSTGSMYLNSSSISSIDFLKIDVEGMDFRVLKGFGDKLEVAKVIQFEYGIFNISSHDLLADFFTLLEAKGFLVGKIYPCRVKFFEYHFENEDFGGHNYLAVRKDQKNLIEVLSGLN